MKAYSFIDEAQLLNENRFRSAAAGGLALLGTLGSFGIKMPASYVRTHPGATSMGKAVVQQMVKPSAKKVNWGREFTRGMNFGMDSLAKVNPAAKAQKTLGDAVIKTARSKSGGFKQAFTDAARGNVSL